MTEAELLEILARGESERVEFKASERADLRTAVCALANDLSNSRKPAYLLVGVDDRGAFAGLTVDDAMLQKLAQIRSSGDLQPLPSMTVERLEAAGGACAVISIAPSDDPPIRYRGRVMVRIGTTTQVANAQDERILIERRRGADLPFDHRAARDASLADIDVDYFDGQYLPNAYAPDVLEANGRSHEERLHALRFMSPPHVTYGGLLTLGVDPQRFVPGAFVQFVVFNGRSITDDPIDQKVFSGRLGAVTYATLEVLGLAIPRSLSRNDGPTHGEGSPYPIAALRELVVNAIMHRDYESGNAPVRVYMFDDRLEITSPGGPCEPLRRDRFGESEMTAYRNPIVADALKTLGFAQRFGFGIPFAKKALAENGNAPPRFQVENEYVNVVVEKRT